MKILAIEFSSPQRSVAVVEAAKKGAPKIEAEVIESGGAVSKPLAMAEEALRSAGLEREQVDCVAVGTGPGSYTGIRTGIALAQGWELACSVKLLGVSSAEAIVAEAHAQGLAGQAAVIIDAQRGEFYLALYELNPAGWRELEPLRLASVAEVQARCQGGAQLIGPEVTASIPRGRVVFPRAAVLSKLATSRSDFVSGENLEPIYLRQTTFVKATSVNSALDIGTASPRK